MLNERHAILEGDESQILQNYWKMSKILLANWSVDFAMDHKHENERMKEAKNTLPSLISSLNLGSEGMPIEE